MSLLALGGGTGAVAASAHAGCERFRGTDPMVTKQPRSEIAKAVGIPDIAAGIPQARWIRARTFENLIRNEAFASEIATKSVGFVDLPRPKSVAIVNAAEDVAATLIVLQKAVKDAIGSSIATLIHAPAVPYPGFDALEATAVHPDFVIVTTSESGDSAVLIVGDAKDYERIRARIDDQRYLKGFLQVAFGAEAFARWVDLPADLTIAGRGVLAVPRNTFLQPTVVSEDLTDHRREVAFRLAERVEEAANLVWTGDAKTFVDHLTATFEPFSCTSCPLYGYCRDQLRSSSDPLDFLAELGIPKNQRAALVPLVDGTGDVSADVPKSLVSRVHATISGVAIPTGQKRLDPVGLSGTVNVVLVKADSSSMATYGIGVQSTPDRPWEFSIFEQPQAEPTRRAVLFAIGRAIGEAMQSNTARAGENGPDPVHVVVPDLATADLLATMADSLAGVEISRLRWEHDESVGRQALTFDGNPATIPTPLKPEERLAVSFLLEEDRARAFSTRSAVVDIRTALSRLIIPGGPEVNFGLLDYLVGWAESSTESPVDARKFADDREQSGETPGAKLSKSMSDALSTALTGSDGKQSIPRFRELAMEALEYRAETFNRAVGVLQNFPVSNLRDAHRRIEADAQVVWRRRMELQAYDLIRFSATPEYWRNTLVAVVERDATCATQLKVLADPTYAEERARNASVRELAVATVVSTDPLTIEVASRRLTAGSKAVLLHVNGVPEVEKPAITFTHFTGNVRVNGLATGPLVGEVDPENPRVLRWDPVVDVALTPGDTLVLAESEWFGEINKMKSIKVERPSLDKNMAPGPDCSEESWLNNPDIHQYCCQPHVAREAGIADFLAQKRNDGELNPQVWPPIQDTDSFDVTAHGEMTAEEVAVENLPVPEALTMDDLD